ncbi:MAG TPA: ABC transporter permease subunit, partial [Baekduia sp.]|nr:ABC transporter permease subunit [Baekduia sp.]
MPKTVILGTARTPIGKLGGGLSTLDATDLGGIAIQAALERVPRSYLEASSDLGATPNQTFRNVLLPLVFPGIVAGSIF